MDQMIEKLNSAEIITDELISQCKERCIEKNNDTEGILKLKELAKDCETKADYINFFTNTLMLNAIESERGIVLHLGKKMWSLFFGVPIDIEILESFWRGGSDCVLEIIF